MIQCVRASGRPWPGRGRARREGGDSQLGPGSGRPFGDRRPAAETLGRDWRGPQDFLLGVAGSRPAGDATLDGYVSTLGWERLSFEIGREGA